MKKKAMVGGKFVVYKVWTHPFDYKVVRRYNDFKWLRSILVREFPASYIPPLPSKDGRRSFEQEYLNKRSEMLEQFIQAVMQHRELRSSVYVDSFLKEPSHDKFTKIRSQLDKRTTTLCGMRDNTGRKMFGPSRANLRKIYIMQPEIKSMDPGPKSKRLIQKVDELNRITSPLIRQ